jgi:hypothetical protein
MSNLEPKVSGQFKLTFHDATRSRVFWTFARENAVLLETIGVFLLWGVTAVVTVWNYSSPIFLTTDSFQNPDRLLFPSLFFWMVMVAYYVYRRKVIRRGENFDDYRVSEVKFTLDNDGFHYEQVMPMQTIVTDLKLSRLERIWITRDHLTIVDQEGREYILKKSAFEVGNVDVLLALLMNHNINVVIVRT